MCPRREHTTLHDCAARARRAVGWGPGHACARAARLPVGTLSPHPLAPFTSPVDASDSMDPIQLNTNKTL